MTFNTGSESDSKLPESLDAMLRSRETFYSEVEGAVFKDLGTLPSEPMQKEALERPWQHLMSC